MTMRRWTMRGPRWQMGEIMEGNSYRTMKNAKTNLSSTSRISRLILLVLLSSRVSVITARDVHRYNRHGRHLAIRTAVVNDEHDDTLLLTCRGGGQKKAQKQQPLKEKPKRLSAALNGAKSGLASAMSAACVKTLLQPIDAIKTIQQYHQTKMGGQSLTILQACRKIMDHPSGFMNFYAGLGVTVIGAMPGVALYFGVYQYCKNRFLASDYGSHHKTLSIAMAAAIGNSVASFSRVPYETLKQKLQTGAYESTWHALKSAAATPVQSLFPKGGIAVQMIRDIPYAVVTLLLYESLQTAFNKRAAKHAKNNNISSSQSKLRQQQAHFILGGLAGGLGSWVTNPMDVVKTRLQTDDPTAPLYNGSMLMCAKAVWQEGGVMAFLRGSVPRLTHKIPANAFFFLFYETFKRLLRVEEAAEPPVPVSSPKTIVASTGSKQMTRS